ncbi:hypothetical protein FRB90_003193 [Tulasnella sp. 427]|nr:hypothetical protein FRB90_003193 [Tulasnella sp. 427]
MPKGKGKKKEPTPEPDTIILYIENPIGIFPSKDWYKNPHALNIVSTWLYFLADAGEISRPSSLWYRGGVGSSYLYDIAVDLYIPESDPARVEYTLGYHYWKNLPMLRRLLDGNLMVPRDEERHKTTVYRSPCNSTVKLQSDQFLQIPLSERGIANLRLGSYTPPTLPHTATLKSTYKEPLPARAPPPCPPSQPSADTNRVQQADDDEKQNKKAILAPSVKREGGPPSVPGASSVSKQEETFFRTKEQLDYEMSRLAASGGYRPPPSTPHETKPNITSSTNMTKEEQFDYEFAHLIQSNYHTPPEPSQSDVKPVIKEEQSQATPALPTTNNSIVPPEHRYRETASSGRVKPEPDPSNRTARDLASGIDPSGEPSRRVKEELLDFELARFSRSSPRPTPIIKTEPGPTRDPRVRPEPSVGVRPGPDIPSQAARKPPSGTDRNGEASRRVKEELLDMEIARLSRSTPGPAPIIKTEPGRTRDPRIKPEPLSGGPNSAISQPAVKSEPGSYTPGRPIPKRTREQEQESPPAHRSAEKKVKREW